MSVPNDPTPEQVERLLRAVQNDDIDLGDHDCETCPGCNMLKAVVDAVDVIKATEPMDFADQIDPDAYMDWFLEIGSTIDWLNIVRTALTGLMIRQERENKGALN
jgi:hypothetical protein